MAEYVGGEPMTIDVGDPILRSSKEKTFENKTDDNFSVDVGIVFRKSGLYRVAVDGKHTTVEIEPERKKGKWIIDRKFGADIMSGGNMVICSECGKGIMYGKQNFCPNCGADMRGVDE